MSLLSIRSIGETVAEVAHVPWSHIRSSRRDKPTSHARHVALWQARGRTQHSLPQIAAVFGGLDHSSVLYAVHRIDAMPDDPLVVASTDALDKLTAALAEAAARGGTVLNAVDLALRVVSGPVRGGVLSPMEAQTLARQVLADREFIASADPRMAALEAMSGPMLDLVQAAVTAGLTLEATRFGRDEGPAIATVIRAAKDLRMALGGAVETVSKR